VANRVRAARGPPLPQNDARSTHPGWPREGAGGRAKGRRTTVGGHHVVCTLHPAPTIPARTNFQIRPTTPRPRRASANGPASAGWWKRSVPGRLAPLAHNLPRARPLKGNSSIAPCCRASGDPGFARARERPDVAPEESPRGSRPKTESGHLSPSPLGDKLNGAAPSIAAKPHAPGPKGSDGSPSRASAISSKSLEFAQKCTNR
jgi:hypothetical protein